MKQTFYPFFGLALCLLSQCYTYEENPLNPQEEIQITLLQRQILPSYCSDTQLTFADCVQWMSDSSYTLKTVKAEYEMYKAVAEIKTPYPNPSVSAGPNLVFGSGVVNNVVPYASMGFIIPLGPRLSRQDDVYEALMRQAHQKTLITHRQLYLDLRKAYLSCVIAQSRVDLTTDIYQKREAANQLFNDSFEAGRLRVFDLKVNHAETQKSKNLKINAQAEYKTSVKELASLLGVKAHLLMPFSFEKTPPTIDSLFSLDSIPNLMIQNNLELAAIESEYRVADMNYKLELAKQIPDLAIGPNYSMDEDYISTITPSVGIELPVSDRNQQAIVSAKMTRDLALARYKEQLHEILNTAENTFEQYHHLNSQLNTLRHEMKPALAQAEELALNSTHAGMISTIDYLTAVIAHRETLLEELNLELAQLNALTELEKSVGIPLAPINNESFVLFDNLREASTQIINDEPPVTKEN